MAVAVAMAAMHERVQKDTGKWEQPDQRAEYVGAMFTEKKQTGDDEEPNDDQRSSRTPTARFGAASGVMILRGHLNSSWSAVATLESSGRLLICGMMGDALRSQLSRKQNLHDCLSARRRPQAYDAGRQPGLRSAADHDERGGLKSGGGAVVTAATSGCGACRSAGVRLGGASLVVMAALRPTQQQLAADEPQSECFLPWLHPPLRQQSELHSSAFALSGTTCGATRPHEPSCKRFGGLVRGDV